MRLSAPRASLVVMVRTRPLSLREASEPCVLSGTESSSVPARVGERWRPASGEPVMTGHPAGRPRNQGATSVAIPGAKSVLTSPLFPDAPAPGRCHRHGRGGAGGASAGDACLSATEMNLAMDGTGSDQPFLTVAQSWRGPFARVRIQRRDKAQPCGAAHVHPDFPARLPAVALATALAQL